MMTHDNCVLLAAKWLKQGNPVGKISASQITTEISFMDSVKEPDVFGVNPSLSYSVMIECKVQRVDFLRDRKKLGESDEVSGEGLLWCGQYKYFCCPEGLISEDELPYGWGLLVVKAGKVLEEVVKPTHRFIYPTVMDQDFKAMASIIRRVNGSKKIVFNRRNKNDN